MPRLLAAGSAAATFDCSTRHSSATLMITKGCNLRSVQAILRHRDIHTTLRYTHICDTVKMEKQSQYPYPLRRIPQFFFYNIP